MQVPTGHTMSRAGWGLLAGFLAAGLGSALFLVGCGPTRPTCTPPMYLYMGRCVVDFEGGTDAPDVTAAETTPSDSETPADVLLADASDVRLDAAGLDGAVGNDAGLDGGPVDTGAPDVPSDGGAADSSEGGPADASVPPTCTGAVCSRAVSLSLGDTFGCALLDDGTVRCWGANDRGQQADGAATDVLTPRPIPGITDARQLSAGWAHACVVNGAGQVLCWGLNNLGQLGRATTSMCGAYPCSPVPAAVPGLSGVVEVRAGLAQTCARLADRTVRCWGYNAFGQLGDGTMTDRLAPAAVTGLTNTTQLEVMFHYGCARLTDTSVACWGADDYGQLGVATTASTCMYAGMSFPCALTPVAIPAFLGVAELSTGAGHACALMQDTSVRCWGVNTLGELGDGTMTSRPTPQAVTGLTGVIQVRAGGVQSCALRSDHSVVCWGGNNFGQVGDGTMMARSLPTPVAGLAGVREVATGGVFTCARTDAGRVACWGRNESGELGDGTRMDRTTPTTVVW